MPASISAFVAPAVSSAHVASRYGASVRTSIHTSRSSMRTTPTPAPRFTCVHGMTCFCPLSAIAQNHGGAGGAQSHARIAALSALFAERYPRAS